MYNFEIQEKSKSFPKNQVVGNYIIGKSIGKGTFGNVKLAVHTITGEKVAIKILEKSRIKDSSDIERVSRELKILKQVNHPNVVKLYEIIETPKQIYLAMEYMPCGELFDYIVSRNKLSEEQACLFYQQILSGLDYLHKSHIIHRDLKPENLLLDQNNIIKIVDFGLSYLETSTELLKTACGSPCYAAPEMIAGKRYKGQSADIWSCGIILFAMVCGYLPFEDPNTAHLYKKIDHSSEEYLNEHVLCSLSLLGLDVDYTRECLNIKKANKNTATYFIILKKNQQSAKSKTTATKINQRNSVNPRFKKLYKNEMSPREEVLNTRPNHFVQNSHRQNDYVHSASPVKTGINFRKTSVHIKNRISIDAAPLLFHNSRAGTALDESA